MTYDKKRKTIAVDDIRSKVNSYLEQDITQPEKQALCVLLESILHETGNYNGYNNNYWMTTGFARWNMEGAPDFPEKEKYIVGPNNDNYGRTYY